MFSVDASLTTDCSDLELDVTDVRPATATRPPSFTLCLQNVGTVTHDVSGGGSMPLSQYSARDAAQPRRIIVYPTRNDGDPKVVPDEPTDATWAMEEAFHDSMHAITTRLDPEAEQCVEYAILTYRPYHDGYPPGRYVVTDEFGVDASRHDDGTPAQVTVTVTIEGGTSSERTP
ncbi:hypothetical protein [Halomarina oriensis]|uniref:Uncharacterized protein n=1 Tax=Halomarina oriensis TaxID=671145 RepID=A0A6B0GNZ4_9EURY|nr:hypothetical protein [Halomarina oriensis]MWG36410.1 hypothetical protein [Halomarina oriensis]